jgi:hypothetical protein
MPIEQDAAPMIHERLSEIDGEARVFLVRWAVEHIRLVHPVSGFLVSLDLTKHRKRFHSNTEDDPIATKAATGIPSVKYSTVPKLLSSRFRAFQGISTGT